MAMASETANSSSSSKVKVTEVTKVKPHHQLGDSITAPSSVLPLTHFDLLIFRVLPPVERLYFYEVTDLTRDSFNSVILPNLKHSLSLTLLHYLPLAGNIMWPEQANKPAVYFFPDDGVSFTVAESSNADADFILLSGNGIRSADEFRPLVPQLSISDDKAEVVSVQITLFPNQGYTIGTTTSHAVLDGKSSTLFVKSWAYLCKQLQSGHSLSSSLPPELTPFLDRSVIKDHQEEQNKISLGDDARNLQALLAKPFPVDMNNLVRATFELSREDIKKRRDEIINEMNKSSNGHKKELHLSTFSVTCAHGIVLLTFSVTCAHGIVSVFTGRISGGGGLRKGRWC